MRLLDQVTNVERQKDHGAPRYHPDAANCGQIKIQCEERKIYLLIAERYLANLLPVHEYLACSIELRIATERFSAKGRLVTKPG